MQFTHFTHPVFLKLQDGLTLWCNICSNVLTLRHFVFVNYDVRYQCHYLCLLVLTIIILTVFIELVLIKRLTINFTSALLVQCAWLQGNLPAKQVNVSRFCSHNFGRLRKSHNKYVKQLLGCWRCINLSWLDAGRVPRFFANYLQAHPVYFIWSRSWK